MRVRGVPFVVVAGSMSCLALGCGTVSSLPEGQVAGRMPRKTPAAAQAPAAAPAAVDPMALATRLQAIQPAWPATRRSATFRPRLLNCTMLKCVALTFDDGPGKLTRRLLDDLAARQAKATFFVVGRMIEADGPDTLRRMVAEGHELGNHTWDHPSLPSLSRAGVKSQMVRTQKAVSAAVGVKMQIMRPPYGATNDSVAVSMRDLGLAQILWNVDTVDWRDRNPAVVFKRAVKAPPGSIVLMHDIHKTTVEAVPPMLDALLAKGYTFVTVSELYGKAPAPGGRYTKR
ncbi:Peptidoglycan/xylan/chitin deacetylase, PgdA/CDA1 family [Sinosporangium album]|uniref:Peptidoglycan/xylan/chitin deacetylase, PgdA/CDA1 family n=1 Tax=Sinosporangium album TaxID=504805 RepID=A0A1G8B2G7_9ACTN|nr:polysaccharide deacetylase family protein [Sinosporangium album]SDH27366.1 Peptidoglycan/xylan/chitin deacetylase, PgdA/CDA1 family [Sinosporangium album]